MSSSDAAVKAAGADQGGKSAAVRMLATGAALVVAAAVGFYLVFQFTEAERERELRDWQSRMAIVADSRFADIDRWLDGQLEDLRGVADNQSVQLYMTLLHEEGASAGDEDAPAELGYLQNLLTVVADRAGFTGEISGPEVNANVNRVGVAGLALVADDGLIVVSSPGFPPIQGKIQSFLAELEPGSAGISDMYLNASGNPAMAFAVPVFALQAEESAATQLATVIGVKEVGDELFPLLEQPGATEETSETLLVRQSGQTAEYLTPLADGTGPLKTKLAMDTAGLAAAWAIQTPGGFAIRTDYDGNEVLAISRGFEQVPWTLLYKVDRSEALAESEERLNTLMIVFGLIILLVLGGMVALWYYGTSKRANEAATRFEQLAKRFQGQRNFMHLVTDSQPNVIVIMDEHGHFRWFNQKALNLARMERGDMFDKHVSAVLGPVEGKRIAGWVKETLDKDEAQSFTHEMELGEGGPRVYRSDLIPLPAREDFPPGVLMVSQDITDSVKERERRENAMRQLVETLVSVVDQRDPYSAHHSARVGRVARAVAEEMELDRTLVETTNIAGNLMNLGKIAVPSEVLTKQGQLTDEEMRMIQQSVLTSAEMVRRIDFDGPVYETLAQLQENYDGSGGPQGLKGEQIEVTARIAAAANAFVGMVSARAWRSGMDFDKAVDILLQEGNKKFDRSVVVALANVLDNRGGRDKWADFGEPPEDDQPPPA
ncbi:MAG: HD domain-containing phosphohydrolase [Marivibrio sp.]|uniref:HD domain-containing phosphohydrolase n=1 Tax=Marivibrio sp. TaxID=2039719 RepID=UPI0032ECB45F